MIVVFVPSPLLSLVIEQATTNDSKCLIFAQFRLSLTKSVYAHALGGFDHGCRSLNTFGRGQLAQIGHLCQVDLSNGAGDLAPHLVCDDKLARSFAFIVEYPTFA